MNLHNMKKYLDYTLASCPEPANHLQGRRMLFATESCRKEEDV